MDKKIRSYTQRYNGFTSTIVTPCKISEAFDPDIPEEEYPQFTDVKALWDTGATNTCISKDLVSKLNLLSNGQVDMEHANGNSKVPTHLISVILPNNLGFSSVKALECDLSGTDMLIGMDIISQGDFSICNSNNKTCFSFQIPSTNEIDFCKKSNIQEIKKSPILKGKKIGANERCPCGSGKKYKHCCGKNK